jgi:hypothetical protein
MTRGMAEAGRWSMTGNLQLGNRGGGRSIGCFDDETSKACEVER